MRRRNSHHRRCTFPVPGSESGVTVPGGRKGGLYFSLGSETRNGTDIDEASNRGRGPWFPRFFRQQLFHHYALRCHHERWRSQRQGLRPLGARFLRFPFYRFGLWLAWICGRFLSFTNRIIPRHQYHWQQSDVLRMSWRIFRTASEFLEGAMSHRLIMYVYRTERLGGNRTSGLFCDGGCHWGLYRYIWHSGKTRAYLSEEGWQTCYSGTPLGRRCKWGVCSLS